MLRKMLGWGEGDVNVPCTCTHVGAGLGWGDVNVPCACTHVGCYARCWVGVGGMLTFLALAHMLDATQDAGLGWGDVNVPCTCTQVKHCLLQFARTFAKNGRKVIAGTQVIDKMWGHFDDFLPKSIHNKSKATRLINDQIWEYLYSWQWRQNAGKDLWTNMHEVFAE